MGGFSVLGPVLAELRRDRSFMGNVAHWEVIPGRSRKVVPMPEGVPDTLRSILRGRGVEQLYSHQMDAFGHVMAGKNVVLATSTATGKTLAYNLPILTQLLNDAEATALYLFPTKALSQDQRAELENVVLKGALPVQVCACDGDTRASRRRSARDRGRIVITNPDMLHVGILPHLSLIHI